MPHERAPGVTVEINSIVNSGDNVMLHWVPEAILPTETSDSYTLDITLREYDERSAMWISTEIARDMPNSGSAEITVPERPPKGENESAVPAVFQIAVSESSTDTATRKRGLLSSIFKKVVRAITFVTRVVIAVLFPQGEVLRRLACEAWGLSQSRAIAEQIASELPACPCTAAEAESQRDTFKEEPILSVLIFHPNSDKCFRQRNP